MRDERLISGKQGLRVLIAGGGTGGHVYPALSIAEALAHDLGAQSNGNDARYKAVDFLYVGGRNGLEEGIVSQAGLKFKAVPAGAMRGKAPWRAAAAGWRVGQGYVQSKKIIEAYHPAVLLATGGYVCVPVVLAARARGVPVVVNLPDVEPGWAVWLISHMARYIAVTTEEASRYLPAEKVVVTGYPVRDSLGKLSRSEGRWVFGLDEASPVVLVLGGSRGARSINDALIAALPSLLTVARIIHVCGKGELSRVRSQVGSLSPDLRRRYVLRPYLEDDLDAAFASADLCVSRAGASVLGEYPIFGLPSVLVPYPFAGAHQEHNADFMVRAGAAIKLADGELHRLSVLLQEILADHARLDSMALHCRKLAQPGAALSVAALVQKCAE